MTESSDTRETKIPMTPARGLAHLERHNVTPAKLLEACPTFVGMAKMVANGETPDANWPCLLAAGKSIAISCGASGQLLEQAVRTVGPEYTAAMIAWLYEHSSEQLFNTGKRIRSFGGYITFLVNIARYKNVLDIGDKFDRRSRQLEELRQ